MRGLTSPQNASFVADRRRLDVLVAGGVADDGVGVHAALVSKGTGADEGLIGTIIHVGNFIHVARDFREVGKFVWV